MSASSWAISEIARQNRLIASLSVQLGKTQRGRGVAQRRALYWRHVSSLLRARAGPHSPDLAELDDMDIISCFPADELAAAENDAIHYFEQLRERDEEGDEEETADLLRRDPDYDPNDSLYRGQYCAARRLHAGLLHSYGVAADLVPELWVLIIGLLNIARAVYLWFAFDVLESLCSEPLLSASCHSELSAFAIRARLPSARTQQRDFGKFDVANMAAIGLNHVVSSFRDAFDCFLSNFCIQECRSQERSLL
jgi:hypothetical protein